MQSRRNAIIVGLLALGLVLWQQLSEPGAPAQRSGTLAEQQPTAAAPRAQLDERRKPPDEAHAPDALRLPPRRVVEQMRILDQRGDVLYRGPVDLQPTLERIVAGGRYPHRNDGGVFQNRPPPGQREPALPRQPQGYYREYVHPTLNTAGPGPQRIVVGRGGQFYYTPDHYQTFIPLQ
jgi:guanyl-specific ribonuclease Sa